MLSVFPITLRLSRLSTYFALCHGDYDDDIFCLLFSAGELEKQQGAKTHSVKNNGTQLELRGKQGSPSGVCECVCVHCRFLISRPPAKTLSSIALIHRLLKQSWTTAVL